MLSDTLNSTRPAQSLVPEWPWSFRSILVLAVCGTITILTILGWQWSLFSARVQRCWSIFRQWSCSSLGEIPFARSIVLGLLHRESLLGWFLCRTLRHAIDDHPFDAFTLAISLSSLLHMDVHWFYLLDRIISNLGFHGIGSILRSDR